MDPHFRRSVTVCLAPKLTSAEFLKEMTIAIRNDDSMSTKVASDLFNGKVAPQTLIELAKMLTDSAAGCELIAACAVKLTRTEVYQAFGDARGRWHGGARGTDSSNPACSSGESDELATDLAPIATCPEVRAKVEHSIASQSPYRRAKSCSRSHGQPMRMTDR